MEPDTTTGTAVPVTLPAIDLEDDAQVLTALRRAVAEALRTHREKGQYVVGSRDGKPVRVAPQNIVVPEVTD